MDSSIQNIAADTEKNFSTNKVLGYVLLACGVLMIFAALFLIWGVLSGRTKAPVVFNIEAPAIDVPGSQSTLELPESLKQAGVTLNQPAASGQKMKIIPDSLYNDSLNIGVYYLLMMFLASSGAKIAGIGTNLLKDFKVKVK